MEYVMPNEIVAPEPPALSDSYEKPFSLEPHWYFDATVYQAEAQGVFNRNWQCAGHISEFVNAGDFTRLDFCDESILVVRGDDGALRAFYNVCQHRGHILVADRRSNLKGKIRCPYHSWMYGLDGVLRRAPNEENVPGFSASRIRLPEVRVEEYGTFVWVNTHMEATPISELAPGLDEAIRAHVPDVETAVLFEGNKTTLPINWKTQVDNAVDTYHFQFSGPAHRELTGSMEFSGFQRETHDYWLVEWGLPGNPAQSGYDFDPNGPKGEADGLTIIWVYPDLQIVAMPGSRTFFTYRTTPFGGETTVLDYAYYGAPEVRNTDVSRAAIDWMNGPLSTEDNVLTTGVHLGHKSKGFPGSHFMVDLDHGRYSEHPGVAFHTMLYEHTKPYLK
jgi:phenylpropionate dioxygenase-like ring-hydroxylating dioxygenase large terminal subunit